MDLLFPNRYKSDMAILSGNFTILQKHYNAKRLNLIFILTFRIHKKPEIFNNFKSSVIVGIWCFRQT